MKLLPFVVLFGALAFVLSSCTPSRKAGMGYRPYGIYSSQIYDDAPGGWDIYRSRGGGTRVKYTE